MRPLIYIAGPLGLPDRIGWYAVAANIHRAQTVAMDLVRVGWSPVVPHSKGNWPDAFELPHETWLEVDEPLLRACQAIVRLSGESAGSDYEVELADKHGIRLLTLEEALRGPAVALGWVQHA